MFLTEAQIFLLDALEQTSLVLVCLVSMQLVVTFKGIYRLIMGLLLFFFFLPAA